MFLRPSFIITAENSIQRTSNPLPTCLATPTVLDLIVSFLASVIRTSKSSLRNCAVCLSAKDLTHVYVTIVPLNTEVLTSGRITICFSFLVMNHQEQPSLNMSQEPLYLINLEWVAVRLCGRLAFRIGSITQVVTAPILPIILHALLTYLLFIGYLPYDSSSDGLTAYGRLLRNCRRASSRILRNGEKSTDSSLMILNSTPQYLPSLRPLRTVLTCPMSGTSIGLAAYLVLMTFESFSRCFAPGKQSAKNTSPL